MKKIALQFALQLSIVTVILSAILLVVVEFSKLELPTFTTSIFIFLFLVTYLIFLFQIRILLNNPEYAMHVIIGSLIIRLILFVIFNFIMIYTDRANALPNVVLFFAIYIAYTVVEMIALFRRINLQKNGA